MGRTPAPASDGSLRLGRSHRLEQPVDRHGPQLIPQNEVSLGASVIGEAAKVLRSVEAILVDGHEAGKYLNSAPLCSENTVRDRTQAQIWQKSEIPCRISGMYGERWSGPLVLARIIAAFRVRPGVPILFYSRGGVPMRREEAVLEGRDTGKIDGPDLIQVAIDVLGRESKDWVWLQTYARAQANGVLVRDFCKAKGWPKSTLLRRIAAATGKVAEELNRVAVQRRVGLRVGPV